jgi:hypothetical protein
MGVFCGCRLVKDYLGRTVGPTSECEPSWTSAAKRVQNNCQISSINKRLISQEKTQCTSKITSCSQLTGEHSRDDFLRDFVLIGGGNNRWALIYCLLLIGFLFL